MNHVFFVSRIRRSRQSRVGDWRRKDAITYQSDFSKCRKKLDSHEVLPTVTLYESTERYGLSPYQKHRYYRQVGKSSLLMRIIQTARNAGKRVAYLDFQQLNTAVLKDEELFFRHFCSWLSDVLELEDKVEESFRLNLTTIQRCDRYLQRHILKGLGHTLVLAIDEVDRVFDTNFRNDFFGMLRSWHNSRAIYPRA